jgi:hypothetical protein
MILTEAMVDALHAIRRIESNKISRILNVPAIELGNRLIDVYYSSSNLQTRELIRDFMEDAGVVWMRKLITRDNRAIASTSTRFASLTDYIELLAANDERAFQNLTG